MTPEGPSPRRRLPVASRPTWRSRPILPVVLWIALLLVLAAPASGQADPAATVPGGGQPTADESTPGGPANQDPTTREPPASDPAGLIADAEARLRAGLEVAGLPIGTRCVTPGARLDIAGIGRAVYDTIEIDTAAGTARLAGGVCIEVPDADLVLRALSFEISGLALNGGDAATAPVIAASRARLDVGGWRLSVESLQGSIEDLALRDINLRSPGVVGRAATGRVGSGEAGFEATLRQVAMATHDYRLDARVARLRGDVLLLEEAAGTTCVCGSPRFVLLSDVVRADLGEDGDMVVNDPVLRVLGVHIPLVGDLALGAEGGPSLELSFAVAGREDLGTIAIVRGRPEEGLRVEVGVATHPEPWPLAVLDARRPGDRIRLEVDGRGLLLDARRQRDVGGGAWVAALSETVLRGDEPRLRAGAEAGWSGRREDELAAGVTLTNTLSARLGAEVAVEPGGVADDPRPAGDGAAAVRLPFSAQFATGLALGGGVRADLTTSVTAAAYLTAPQPGRLAVNVAPSVTLAGRDARLVLGAQRRWTAGDGPFEFDDVDPRARLSARAEVNLGALHVDARALWRLAPETPGAEDLRLRADLDVPLGSGWTLTPALRGEFADLAGGPNDEDWIEAELAARHGEDTRVSLRARQGLEPVGLRDLVLAAQTPIRVTRSLRVVPFLAVDVAPWLNGGGPELYGHGLRLYVDDCCGTFVVGYRAVDGEWSVELDLRLPPLDLGEPPLPESALQDVPLLLGPVPGGAIPGSAAPGGPVPGGPAPGGPVPGGSGPGGPVPMEPIPMDPVPMDPGPVDPDPVESDPASPAPVGPPPMDPPPGGDPAVQPDEDGGGGAGDAPVTPTDDPLGDPARRLRAAGPDADPRYGGRP